MPLFARKQRLLTRILRLRGKKLFKFLRSDIGKILLTVVLFVPAIVLEHFSFDIAASALFILALIVAGGDVFVSAIRGILRRDLLDEKFLMSIASVGAMIVGEWSEGVAVMLFFLIGETFEHHAVRRSRSSIRALMDICPDEACILTESGEERVDAEDVPVGAKIIIRSGERVPLDCEVLRGRADIDTSSMTGEPLPRAVGQGDALDSGVVVVGGMLICKTVRHASDSAAARVLALVESASENKAKEESFITKFSRVYTPTVVISALIIALVLPILQIVRWDEAIYRALIFLVISCPCALVISVPMAFFGGIGGAASRGILFKGGNVFSKIAKADTVAFDKTGTLTGGEFAISRISSDGIGESELLSLAASAEYASNHPIALALKRNEANLTRSDSAREVAGEGIISVIRGEEIAVGNTTLMERVGATVSEALPGEIFVARDGKLIGRITVSDEIKSEASGAITFLRSLGVKRTAILSGDRRENVERVASVFGIDIALGELSPENKYNKLEELISTSRNSTVYVGDGINDAPSLARADVGVAMGAIGQDSAIEAADVVLMTDNLDRLPEAMLIARKTLRIAKENIVFALGIKLLVMLLGALGFANMWLAVFADVGVAVLAILNSMRALKTPKAKPTRNKT